VMKILIVDDEQGTREDLCSYFLGKGWQAECTGSGNDAVALLSQQDQRFDAVVLDILLEGRNGPRTGDQVVLWMREQPHLADCCIVILTARPQPNSAVQALKLGAFHYLAKPLKHTADLESVLRAGIAWHRANAMRGELLKTLDPIRLMSKVIELLRDTVGSPHVYPALLQPEGPAQRINSDGSTSDDMQRRLFDRILARATYVLENDRVQVARLDPVCSDAGSLIAVPIMASQDQLRGLLAVESEAENAFDRSWVDVLRYLADLIGIGLEIGKEVELVRQVYRELRHSIATNIQIVGTQARSLEKLLQEDPKLRTESIHERVRFIVENSAIVEKTLQDLKAVAAEPPRPHIEVIDAAEVIESCIREQVPKLDELGITVGFAPPPDPVLLPTDRALLAYSLRCILNNAIESIRDNRRQALDEPSGEDRIDVFVADTAESVRIEIRDTGVGFDNDTARQLFQPLFSTKARRLPAGETSESSGIDRVERLLELMGHWCRHDARGRSLSPLLGQGMELFIKDGDTVRMYIGHRDFGGLDLTNLEETAHGWVGTDSPLASEWVGRGEGLFSVRKYIARLGGSVSPSSDGTGTGATFTIRLPKHG